MTTGPSSESTTRADLRPSTASASTHDANEGRRNELIPMPITKSRSQDLPSPDGSVGVPAASSLLTLRREGSSIFLAGPSGILRQPRSSLELGSERSAARPMRDGPPWRTLPPRRATSDVHRAQRAVAKAARKQTMPSARVPAMAQNC
jgi:hypothetical protein